MATEYEKLLLEYGRGQLDAPTALGRALQHIGQLYAAQTNAGAEQRAWQRRVTTVEIELHTMQSTVERLQRTQTTRLQSLEVGLAALQRMVADWQTDVDSLTVPKAGVPRSQGA